MFADDAVVDFGPLGTVRGHEQIRGIHAYDIALEATLEFSNCVQSGQSVSCEVTESNLWLKKAGIDSIRYSANRFEFGEDGKIAAVFAAITEESVRTLSQAMNEFMTWGSENQPDRFGELFDASGRFVYSGENGEKVLGLLDEWNADRAGETGP